MDVFRLRLMAQAILAGRTQNYVLVADTPEEARNHGELLRTMLHSSSRIEFDVLRVGRSEDWPLRIYLIDKSRTDIYHGYRREQVWDFTEAREIPNAN